VVTAVCRKALRADIKTVTEMLCVLYEMPFDELLEENKTHFADANHAFFLAFDGDKPAGVSHVSLRREWVNGTSDGVKGYIEAIYVLPEYRKRGIAAELVKAAENWAAMNGCREMASDCWINNIESYNFHLKIGYKETERCIFFLKKLTAVNYEIRAVDDVLRKKIQPIIVKEWGSPLLAINGKLWDSRTMSGFAAMCRSSCGDDVFGYLLYEFHGGVCEIMLLQSVVQNIGIASALIERVKQLAKENGTSRVIVQTSNDNTHAIRFYQRRGFTIREVRLGALEIARRLKPSIPLIGNDGIPLRDEIEFELRIRTALAKP